MRCGPASLRRGTANRAPAALTPLPPAPAPASAVLDALKTYGKKAFAFAVDNAITLLAVPAVASLAVSVPLPLLPEHAHARQRPAHTQTRLLPQLKVNSMHEEGEIVKLWETYASQDISFNLVSSISRAHLSSPIRCLTAPPIIWLGCLHCIYMFYCALACCTP